MPSCGWDVQVYHHASIFLCNHLESSMASSLTKSKCPARFGINLLAMTFGKMRAMIRSWIFFRPDKSIADRPGTRTRIRTRIRRLGWKGLSFSPQLHQGHCQSQGWIFDDGQIHGGHAPEMALLLHVLFQQKMSWWKNIGSGIATFSLVVHVHDIFQPALASFSPGLI